MKRDYQKKKEIMPRPFTSNSVYGQQVPIVSIERQIDTYHSKPI